MNTKYLSIVTILLCSAFTSTMAQQPVKEPGAPRPETASKTLSVKKTPASDALVQAAKDVVSEQASFDTGFKQAGSLLEPKQKAQSERLTALNKKLLDQLKTDKKYKAMLDEIETLQKEITQTAQIAQADFDKGYGVIHNKLVVDQTLVQSLVPIVRKENDLPDTAVFDVATQTWK